MTRKRAHISTTERVRVFELHGGICHLCGAKIQVGEAWDVSHEIPLEMGGADDITNRLPAHRKCHRTHTAKVDLPQIAQAKRREARNIGAKQSRNPLPGGRNSPWRKKMTGEVVRRS